MDRDEFMDSDRVDDPDIAGSWPFPDWHAEARRIREERAAQWAARRARRAVDRAALRAARDAGLVARRRDRERHLQQVREDGPR